MKKFFRFLLLSFLFLVVVIIFFYLIAMSFLGFDYSINSLKSEFIH